MISVDIAQEIQRLLKEGRLSQRKIARQLGVSRGTVNAIALGKRAVGFPHGHTAADDFLPPDGPVARCPTCGARVQMPCLACLVRSHQQRRRRQGNLEHTPSRQSPTAVTAWQRAG